MKWLRGAWTERKLPQWGLAYLTAAWLLIQVVDVVSEVWGLSINIQRSIQILLALGLPVALTLAWYHGKPGRQAFTKREAWVVGVLVAGAAAMTLGARVLSDSRLTVPPDEALELFNDGQFFLAQFTAEGLQQSILRFRQAIEIDSTFVDPYIGLGHAYCTRSLAPADMDPQEAMPLCREIAERALMLDDELATPHVLLAVYHQNYSWDADATERELELAFQLDPDSYLAHAIRAWHWGYEGRVQDAMTESLVSLRFAANDPVAWASSASLAYMLRREPEATTRARRALELDADNPYAAWITGTNFAEASQSDSALAWLSRFRSGEFPLFKGFLGYAYALASNAAEAESVLEELRESTTSLGLSAASRAVVLAGLGRHAEAAEMFQAAVDERSTVVRFLLASPVGERLSGQPQYRGLRRTLRLP